MEKLPTDKEEAPSITLERTTLKEINSFLEIERSLSGLPTYSAMTTPEEATEEIENSTVYFIRDNGKIVGSVAYQMKSPDHAYISGLAVYPEAQGHGIGTKAMEKVLEELADVPAIDLVTHPDNERAVHLYQSLGFTIGERKENYFGDGEPRIVMNLVRETPSV